MSSEEPPTYVSSQPQILVIPLPESVTFFRGRSVQGEIFVKGLGESSSSSVQSLSIDLHLTNHLPNQPVLTLFQSRPHILYSISEVSSSANQSNPFSSSHRFSLSLSSSLHHSDSSSTPIEAGPSDLPHSTLPGSLDLTAHNKGEIRYELSVKLELLSGEVIIRTTRIEGTPSDSEMDSEQSEALRDVEESLVKEGVKVRVVVDNQSPRLGELLRLGVEVHPNQSEKQGILSPSTTTDPRTALRKLRRVRVELFRRIVIRPSSSEMDSSKTPSPATASASSSTSISPSESSLTHLTLLHASGKSMRYPGPNPAYPPLRVLFTLPSPSLGVGADPTYGEITMITPYHDVSFFVRVTIGFGSVHEPGSSSDASRDWVVERDITYRPRLWRPPVPMTADLEGNTIESDSESDLAGMTEDELAKEAYRRKGLDVVGSSGTVRQDEGPSTHIDSGNDLPPPFEAEAGPSERNSSSHQALPTFTESEEQMRIGDTVRMPLDHSEPDEFVAVRFDGEPDRSEEVGRTGSLTGELATWDEYDGYERFSVQPPRISDSFGVGGSMDPPREGDDHDGVNVVGGMVARLGLEHASGAHTGGLELMEQLGLGEGTRIIDLQDDLPPGIDEPSLPALPDFSASNTFRLATPQTIHNAEAASDTTPEPENLPPPSFDASEAAEAVGGTARAGEGGMSRQGSIAVTPVGEARGDDADAPPGYFGQSGTGHAVLPPYS